MRIATWSALLPLLLGVCHCNTHSPSAENAAAASPPTPTQPPAQPAAAIAKGQTPPGSQKLGEPITIAQETALSEIAKNPRAWEDKVVATRGRVTAVCQSMGCWMEIKDDASEAHIKMAGHSFFIPKAASGHKARVQAKVIKTSSDDECAQEAAEQTGKPVAKLQLEASGVELD